MRTSILYVIVSILILGCVGTDTNPVPTQMGFPKVTISENSPRSFQIGEKHSYSAVYQDFQSIKQDVAIKWSSNNSSVLSVEPDGKSSALSVGLAHIIAQYEGVKDSLPVNVVANANVLAQINITVSKTTLKVGEKISISHTALNALGDSFTEDFTLVWKSSSSHVYVDSEGIVTANSFGVANVTASAMNIVSTPLTFEVVQDGLTGTFTAFPPYSTAGSVTMSLENGKIFLDFSEDFMGGGPSPVAYLSNSSSSDGSTQLASGPLLVSNGRINDGAQRIELPAGVGFNDYKYVYIHCTLGPGLGIAELK